MTGIQAAASKKLRHSRQRERIYEYMCSTKAHPSAEMIYEDLRGELPNLSLGTVYRNLKLLEENGKIVRVASVENHERYDACCEDHAHFVCDRCGGVHDLCAIDREVVNKLCSLDKKSEVSFVHVLIGGICAECKTSE